MKRKQCKAARDKEALWAETSGGGVLKSVKMKVKVTPVSSDSGHKPVLVCRAGFGHILPFDSHSQARYRLFWMHMHKQSLN